MHRAQLLETGILLGFGVMVMLFVARGGRLLSGTPSYLARATLTPNTDVGIFASQPRGERGPAADASYLMALTLRNPEFLFKEIDDRNLVQFPQLDSRWVHVGAIGAPEIYFGLSRALAIKVAAGSKLSVAMSTGDPRLASPLLAMIVTDLREYMRTQTLTELQRESAVLQGQGIFKAAATTAPAEASVVQTLRKQIEAVRSAPDFAFSVKYEPLTINESTGLIWPSASALAVLMILTIVVIARRAGWPGDSRSFKGSSRRAGIHRIA